MLFSATQNTKVTDLARISLRPGSIHIDADKEDSTTSTVSTLSQGLVLCLPEHRFLLLFTLLKKNLKKKVIVLFSSSDSVKYHSELLNYFDVPVLDLHVSFMYSFFFFWGGGVTHCHPFFYAGETETTKTNEYVF